ncbi:MAG TPA: hypothetical protein DCR44_03830 [Acholeplasmatales bacterium]|nr:MAG: hypothetical protein A2Y16_01475 [Tenericutes bacterium GWF2_57_13]HAQ56513.1 hypothetical protein [Acholeplasmatales bacterium]
MKLTTKRLLTSVFSLISVSLLFVLASYAWFNLTQQTQTDLALVVEGEEYEYEFYVYRDTDFLGNAAPTLTDDICLDGSSQDCYVELVDPEPRHLFAEASILRPGNRFSFALKITNISGSDQLFVLAIDELASTGYALSSNKIQRAFVYSVVKIVYLSAGVESADVKDTAGIAYAGKAPLNDPHFEVGSDGPYELANQLPLDAVGSEATMIVFFDLYFDPLVYGVDELDVSTGNSNAFQNQVFIVGKLKIDPVQ